MRLSNVGRAIRLTALAAGLSLAAPFGAEAQGFLGFGYGYPFYAPYYSYYAPRVVVQPAPFAVVPGPNYTLEANRCLAGAYICPTNRSPVGSSCSCPANSGRAAGRVG